MPERSCRGQVGRRDRARPGERGCEASRQRLPVREADRRVGEFRVYNGQKFVIRGYMSGPNGIGVKP